MLQINVIYIFIFQLKVKESGDYQVGFEVYLVYMWFQVFWEVLILNKKVLKISIMVMVVIVIIIDIYV